MGVAKIDPQAAAEAMLRAGYKPLEPYTKSHGKWKCIHIVCGEIVYPSYHGISQGQGGCYACGRKVVRDKARSSENEMIQIMLESKLKLSISSPDIAFAVSASKLFKGLFGLNTGGAIFLTG